MKNKLITQETIDAYSNRFKSMVEHKYSQKGDELFIEKVVAISQQIENLHVSAKINDFIIESDEPKTLGGSDNAARPIDLFLASLANCLEISALLYFSFSKLKIEDVKVSVEAVIDKRAILNDENAPLPGFHNFRIIWDIVTKDSKDRVKKVLKKVEKFCPLSGTLSRSHSFQWIVNLRS